MELKTGLDNVVNEILTTRTAEFAEEEQGLLEGNIVPLPLLYIKLLNTAIGSTSLEGYDGDKTTCSCNIL